MIGKLTRCICIVCLLLMYGMAYADGVAVSAMYQPVTGGYKYFLTVHNNITAQPSRYVDELEITLQQPSELEHPPVWDYTGATGVSAWWGITTALPSPKYVKGIASGNSLSGFNVTSPILVDRFWYRAFTCDEIGVILYGGYAYPTPIPEPSALMALMGGLGALGLPLLRRRK